MKNKSGINVECIFIETLDFIDINYTNLNQTIRYEQRPHVEWIPCSERLPEEIGDYLVTEKISDIARAVYTSSFGHIRTGELCFYYEDDECVAIKNTDSLEVEFVRS